MKRKHAKRVVRARPKARRRARRPNPPAYYIHVQRGSGPVMVWNGRSFNNQPGEAPKAFPSAEVAMSRARALLGKFHRALSRYRIWVSDVVFGKIDERRRVNPENRDPGLDQAARKLEDFTGHEATHVERAPARSDEKTGLVIGELDLIGYRAKRKGIAGGRMQRYGHKFRRSSRPLLAVSTDGKQLHVVGGRYEFTEAGIEDR